MLLKILSILLLLYLAFVAMHYFTQRNLIYYPDTKRPERSEWRAMAMQEVTLKN